MEKFKMKPVFFLICLAGIVLGSWLIYIENKFHMKIFLIGIMIVLLINFINKAFKIYIVDKDNLITTSFLGKKVMPLNEIDHIFIYAKKINWVAFGIQGKNNKIVIESGIKNYQKLMRILIERCKTNNGHIELEVLKRLEKSY